jgi:alcohol dehydrogenase (NADP+)
VKKLAMANGDGLPIVGLGTWKSAPGEVYGAVREALTIGYRHIDCAAIYGNEAEVGSALRDAMRAREVSREALWITSKLWNDAHRRSEVRGALEQTLRDLDVGYLDLYLIHWPVAFRPGVHYPSSGGDIVSPAQAPLHETWAGMEDVADAGLTRHIGVSNFSAAKIRDVLGRCRRRPEVDQVELHPYLQQPELVSYCAAEGIVVTAYSPLGSSDRPALLKQSDEPSLLRDPVISAIAAARGATPAQVLIAWHVSRDIAVIPKSVRPERLRENFAAAQLTLSTQELEQIAALDRHYRFLTGSVWAVEGSPWTVDTLWDERS